MTQIPPGYRRDHERAAHDPADAFDGASQSLRQRVDHAMERKAQHVQQSLSDRDAGELESRRAADIEPESIEWLWPERIALGAITLIAGDPDLGKSTVTLDIASRVSTGCGWPDHRAQQQPGDVLLLSAEDDPARTIVPRLKAAGADLERVHILSMLKYKDGTKAQLNLARDIDKIEQKINEVGDVKIIIIDPISAYCGRVDSHKNAEVRGLIAPLADLATDQGVAVLAVTHLNKSGGGKAIYRAMGSLAFTAAARTVWAVAPDKSDAARRLLLRVKNNLSDERSGLAYTFVSDELTGQPAIRWAAQQIDQTADEALGEHDDDRQTERDDAAEWLRDALVDGPVPSNEIKRQGNDAGHAWSTLRRAKSEQGISAIKRGTFERPVWYWRLPGDDREPAPEGAQDSRPKNVSAFDERERLRTHGPKNGGQSATDEPVAPEGAHLSDVGIFDEDPADHLPVIDLPDGGTVAIDPRQNGAPPP